MTSQAQTDLTTAERASKAHAAFKTLHDIVQELANESRYDEPSDLLDHLDIIQPMLVEVIGEPDEIAARLAEMTKASGRVTFDAAH